MELKNVFHSILFLEFNWSNEYINKIQYDDHIFTNEAAKGETVKIELHLISIFHLLLVPVKQ